MALDFIWDYLVSRYQKGKTNLDSLEHAMKLVKRIFECRIWQPIDIDDVQLDL